MQMSPAVPDNLSIKMPRLRGAGDMTVSAMRVERDFYDLRIYFGDTLHLHIDSSKFIGMQAWTDSEHSFTIEYTLIGGTMRTEYTTEDKWKAVLAGLEKVL